MKSELVLKARKFATKKHEGQLRKGGGRYVEHPIRVARIVRKFKQCVRIDELVAAALLHDTLEDTDTGVSELRENFGEVVALLVVELTSDELRSKVVGKTEYLADKFSNEKGISSWALVIKLADRLDNISDLDVVDVEFAQRYRFQRITLLNNLEKKRHLTRTHKKLIVEIKKKLKEAGS